MINCHRCSETGFHLSMLVCHFRNWMPLEQKSIFNGIQRLRLKSEMRRRRRGHNTIELAWIRSVRCVSGNISSWKWTRSSSLSTLLIYCYYFLFIFFLVAICIIIHISWSSSSAAGLHSRWVIISNQYINILKILAVVYDQLKGL